MTLGSLALTPGTPLLHGTMPILPRLPIPSPYHRRRSGRRDSVLVFRRLAPRSPGGLAGAGRGWPVGCGLPRGFALPFLGADVRSGARCVDSPLPRAADD